MEWIEITCRWALGLQLLFWGLNGFFHWKVIPPSSDFIAQFSDVCVKSRFIMQTVKILEVFFGAMLLSGYGTLIALIFLGPIVFVISGLHVFHNAKWWQVLVPITVPFMILLLTQEAHFRLLLH